MAANSILKYISPKILYKLPNYIYKKDYKYIYNNLYIFTQIPFVKSIACESLYDMYIMDYHNINMIKFLDIVNISDNKDLLTNILLFSEDKNLIFICDNSIIINNYQFDNSDKMYYILMNKIKELNIVCNITPEEEIILKNHYESSIITA